MRKRRLLLATAALTTLGACRPRPIHGNTKHPMYVDAGVVAADGNGGSAAPADARDVPKEPEIIHSNPGPSLYDNGFVKPPDDDK